MINNFQHRYNISVIFQYTNNKYYMYGPLRFYLLHNCILFNMQDKMR